MAKEIHNLEKVLFFKKNVYQPVKFFNKIPGNGDLWIPRNVYNVCMVSGLVAENLSSVSRTFVTAWRSAMKLFGPTS